MSADVSTEETTSEDVTAEAEAAATPAEEAPAAEKPAGEAPAEASAEAPAEAAAEPAEAKPPEKPKHPSGVDPDARFAEGIKEKEKGKEAYEKGNYEAAVEAWCMARGSFKYIVERKLYEDNPEKLEEVYQLQVLINLNLAQASLKNKEFYQAVTHANKVLEVEPRNVKALYRKAAALIDASAFVEAKDTINKLLDVEPGNAKAKQMMLDAERKERASLKSSKKAARKIIGNFERDPRAGLTFRENVKRVASFLIEYVLSIDVSALVKYYRKEVMSIITCRRFFKRKVVASPAEKKGRPRAKQEDEDVDDKKED
mmetsp:Transcript_143178/g.275100  ORF Transcript_143178/g.275100 Transcript_143178/m.275100 type:complete len:314 (+) Transcript_143178:105-1046(+)